jgi:hypothetical protein
VRWDLDLLLADERVALTWTEMPCFAAGVALNSRWREAAEIVPERASDD